MLYRPRRVQYISAFKFKGYKEDDSNFLEMLSIDKVPYGFVGSCQCGRPLDEHGLYNNQFVCPGVYVLYEGRQITGMMSPDNFESIYEPLFEEND